MSNPDNAIIITKRRIACDGGGGALGHPKIWLDMGVGTEVVCKYCDQIFRLDDAVVSSDH